MDELTQQEADGLLALAKFRVNEQRYQFPNPGDKLIAELCSNDRRETFFLDINRSSVSLSKITYQNRARKIVILARLDVDGAPHRNPDHSEISCPHLHLYREGFGDKWAFAVPVLAFNDLTNRMVTLRDFMKFCNIIEPPHIDSSLLS
ncbi:DUF6978 family protein [Bradyrhizobium sp.]|uniref:DUF6978 family protein n=1 Tax=Bradyrhizobium sp. TaxID=376 RepID=UPI003C753325